MKKYLIGFAAIAALTVAVSLGHEQISRAIHHTSSARPHIGINEARANTMTPPYVQWESLGVAAGAIITSPVLNTTGCDDVEVFADNSAGGSTRTLTVSIYASDGTTVLWTAPVASLTTGLRWAINISRYASAQTASASSTIVPHMPGPKIGAVLSSAGAAAGSLAIYCR